MKNPFRGIRAALFDLDGTLIETHINFPFMKHEMIELAARYGVESETLLAMDILTIVEAAREQLERQNRYEEGKRLRVEAFARLEEIEVEQCGAPELIPGAPELLVRLRSVGVKVGIVTRNCRMVSIWLLKHGGLHYDALLTRDDVPRTKPDPAHLIEALGILGFKSRKLGMDGESRAPSGPRTTQDRTPAIMIGDHWMDVQAGKAAGMRTVGVLHQREDGFFDVVGPDLIVRNIADLLPQVASAFEPEDGSDNEIEDGAEGDFVLTP